MYKLIKNELIKFFKRKTIYYITALLFIVIFIYNYINPDQNDILEIDYSQDINTASMEEMLEKTENNDLIKYISIKNNLDIAKLYNRYEKNSWQRFAIQETSPNISIVEELQYKMDIEECIEIINNYELLGEESLITDSEYYFAKQAYNEYIEALDSNNWRRFIELRVEKLMMTKEKISKENKILKAIEIEIEINTLRLKYNINFENDIKNQYLESYKEAYYLQEYYQEITQTKDISTEDAKRNRAKLELSKYAIENNIDYDISPESYNIIYNNKIDARISLIRTFEHFGLIIGIISIYISSTILGEEINRKTIKGLLSKPHKRSTIIISKIITCIIITIFFMLVTILFQFIIGGIIFGFDSYKSDYIIYNYEKAQIIEVNLVKYIALVAITKLPIFIIIIIFCVFMGIINNNISLNIILTIIIFILSNTILEELSKNGGIYIIDKFFITSNWDFSQYLFSGNSGTNLISSIIVYLIYLVVMIELTINKFNKKEI